MASENGIDREKFIAAANAYLFAGTIDENLQTFQYDLSTENVGPCYCGLDFAGVRQTHTRFLLGATQ